MHIKKLGLLLATLLVGLALGLAFRPAPGVAQTGGGGSIAPGDGGMWVVSGGTLRICQQGIRTGVTPARPVCGPALQLR